MHYVVMVTKSGDWEKLSLRLLKLIKNMDELVPVIHKEAPVIVVGMQSKARVKTGFMRDNIVALLEKIGALIWSKAGYSGYQEFGTSRGITPNLFFRPPLAKGWQVIKKRLFRTMIK